MKEGYVKEENENLIVWYSGVCYWIHQNDPCKDMVMISEKIMNEQIDYNELFGFYKIAIQRKSDKTWILLGDNAGSQFWVIDYQKRVFSDRLLELKEQREGDIDPDYGAILQLFSGGYILTEDTVIKNIKRTLSEYCYYISKDSIRRKCKGLKSFSASDGMQLNTLMEVLCKDLDEKHVSCVCTGGTDSRTVLAHLIHYGIKPKLILTGYPDNPDIAVAKKITDTLNLTLEIQDPSLKEEGWIQTAFDFSDGMTDIVGAFRHFNKKQWAMNEQMTYEFGGVGGEYYKNHFFHFFQWRGLHPTYERAFELLCKGITIVPSWGGTLLRKIQPEVEKRIMEIVCTHFEGSPLSAFNEVGMQILQSKSGVLTNQFAPTVLKIDPLTEREIIAGGSKGAVRKHRMHCWQRKEIHQACPVLSDIETDQGYSCTVNSVKLFVERIHMMIFYTGRLVHRIRKKLGLSYVKSEPAYWNRDYADAKDTLEFDQALDVCKQLGVIGEKVVKQEIPLTKTGEILLVGMMFR